MSVAESTIQAVFCSSSLYLSEKIHTNVDTLKMQQDEEIHV